MILRSKSFHQTRKGIARHWRLYVLLLLPLAWLIIFKYVPMYGLQIAFKDYIMRDGFFGSKWVGLKHFENFIGSYYFSRLITNTAGLNIFNVVASFFPPIILAIALNECRLKFFKKSIQMITYAPYFLSTVVVVGILIQILSPTGIVNMIIVMFGGEAVSFMSEASIFKGIYVLSDIWQKTGYNSIIYIAALAGINPEQQEAAEIDGANIWQRIWNVDIPGIMPTAIILFIISTANILNVGFEKVYLMQNPLNMSSSDIIATYTYRMGLVDMNYSFATAVGFFQSAISLIFMTIVNKIAKKVSDVSLW